MKYLYLLILILLMPLTGIAQSVDITRDQESGYFLVVDNDTVVTADTTYFRGDTLSIDGQDRYNYEYTALRAGLSYVARHDLLTGDIKVVGGNRFTIGADLWYFEDTAPPDTVEIPADTIYVPEIIRDTVYVGEETETPLIQGFETELIYRPSDSTTIVNSMMYTHADSLHIYFDCTEEAPLPRYIYGSGTRVVADSFGTQCTEGMNSRYLFFLDSDTVETREETWTPWVTTGGDSPGDGGAWVYTDFGNYATSPAEQDAWTQTWGDLDHHVEDATLVIDLSQDGISRLQWDFVPEHTNIRYRVVETLHASHSTGVHIGGRHSQSDSNKNSVETYVNNNGLGVSLFHNNSWSNPVNFPFEWESGDKVEYVVEITDNTLRAKIWQHGDTEPEEWFSHTSDTIGQISSGYFSIGSTGSGIYIIHELEIEILD